MIETGADVNAACTDNYTALMIATCRGYQKCINLLLKSGADVNTCSTDGSAVLHAIQNWHPDCLKILLEAGADVNLTDDHGYTPLFMATMLASGTNIYVLDLLLKAGAGVNNAVSDGTTPLIIASYNGDQMNIYQLLTAGADVNKVKNKNGESALIASTCEGYYKCLNMLLNARADVNTTAYDGSNALHVNRYINLSHLHRLPKCFRILLRAGIYINKPLKKKG